MILQNELPPAYKIHFTYGNAAMCPPPFNIWDNRDTKELDRIEVDHQPSAESDITIIRTYDLDIRWLPDPTRMAR